MSKFYVVAYVGYEGIDTIFHVSTDREEAARKVAEFRAIATENGKLDEEALYQLPYPDYHWTEPDRVCVMTLEPDGRSYACCCKDLGVPAEKLVLY